MRRGKTLCVDDIHDIVRSRAGLNLTFPTIWVALCTRLHNALLSTHACAYFRRQLEEVCVHDSLAAQFELPRHRCHLLRRVEVHGVVLQDDLVYMIPAPP
eukprot:COSAG06_NODE_6082_length_3119_cov_12.051274_3_plen_100_part_00